MYCYYSNTRVFIFVFEFEIQIYVYLLHVRYTLIWLNILFKTLRIVYPSICLDLCGAQGLMEDIISIISYHRINELLYNQLAYTQINIYNCLFKTFSITLGHIRSFPMERVLLTNRSILWNFIQNNHFHNGIV